MNTGWIMQLHSITRSFCGAQGFRCVSLARNRSLIERVNEFHSTISQLD